MSLNDDHKPICPGCPYVARLGNVDPEDMSQALMNCDPGCGYRPIGSRKLIDKDTEPIPIEYPVQ